MDILSELLNKDKWNEFLEYKLTKSHLNKTEETFLKQYVAQEKYLSIAQKIDAGSYVFSAPIKTLINKSGSTKKRAVYSFSEDENIVLKFISFCLYKYDYVFCPSTYAFRRNITVKQAFNNIIKSGVDNKFSYKLDISNYFNSININLLLPKLKAVLNKDARLYDLLKTILTLNKSVYNGEVITEERGVMAGTPTSTFLANIYLLDLDNYFYNANVTYARYSDDIIVFGQSETEINKHKDYILECLTKMNLVVNPAKVCLTKPHEKWTYLGFSYHDGVVDLSEVTLKKIKDKIRRKARAIYRWKVKNQKETLHAAKVLIRVFNNKFYRLNNTKDLTWSKWFFPIINTSNSLKLIDKHLVQYVRFLSSGKFTKQNYNLTYKKIKTLGYKSLVHEYYKFRQNEQV
ncbi:MAG: hypothetical protein IJE91_04735 [Clostridia bacterium]|nr:hypothetical protein [Clostridia bacterium]